HTKNILMNEDDRALITDFGISKQIKDTTTSSSNMRDYPTLNGVLKKLERLLTEETVEFITNKTDQQPLEYSKDDNILDECDDCCAEYRNATDKLA
ncbi:26463_t:CDS:2, partial [Dentiscutata erythropus]